MVSQFDLLPNFLKALPVKILIWNWIWLIWAIEMSDKWYALCEDRGRIGDDIESLSSHLSRVARRPHGRNSPSQLHLCGRFTCTPPFNTPYLLIHFRAGDKFNLLHSCICFKKSDRQRSAQVKVVSPGWWSVGDGLAPAADQCAGERGAPIALLHTSTTMVHRSQHQN